jgi:hypothetical protein
MRLLQNSLWNRECFGLKHNIKECGFGSAVGVLQPGLISLFAWGG